jgi:hypothetical protein
VVAAPIPARPVTGPEPRLDGVGRAGRYVLSVMVWVATFAVWSGVVGLLVAAARGRALGTADTVSVGVSALFYVALSAVPTVAALLFNDWARDGFPTKAERTARAARPSTAAAGPVEQAPDSEPGPVVTRPAQGEPAAPAAPAGPVSGGYPVAPMIRD